MYIDIYQNNAEKNVLDKTGSLIYIDRLEATLRAPSSIINPTFIIELDINNYKGVVDDNGDEVYFDNPEKQVYFIDNIIAYNYIHCPELNRYYFITDITNIGKNLFIVNCRVDTLMSYKDQILNLNAYVIRSQSTYNQYIADQVRSFRYDKNVIETEITDMGDKANVTFKTQSVHPYNIYLSVLSDWAYRMTYDDTSASNPPSNILKKVDPFNFQGTKNTYDYVVDNYFIQELSKDVYKDDTILSYIKSIVAYPFDIPKNEPYGDGYQIKIGSNDFSYYGTYVYKHMDREMYFVLGDFTISGINNNYLDYDPYTKYELYLPYHQWVQLNAEQILDKRLLVVYVPDWDTGDSQVMIIDYTDNKLIYSSSCKLGVRLSLSSTNERENQNARYQNTIGTALSITNSLLGIDSPSKLIPSGAQVLGSLLQYQAKDNGVFDRGQCHISTANGGTHTPQTIRLRRTYSVPINNIDNKYLKQFGLPLNEFHTLNELSGFTQIGAIHIENISGATDNEINDIDGLLKSGIII